MKCAFITVQKSEVTTRNLELKNLAFKNFINNLKSKNLTACMFTEELVMIVKKNNPKG